MQVHDGRLGPGEHRPGHPEAKQATERPPDDDPGGACEQGGHRGGEGVGDGVAGPEDHHDPDDPEGQLDDHRLRERRCIRTDLRLLDHPYISAQVKVVGSRAAGKGRSDCSASPFGRPMRHVFAHCDLHALESARSRTCATEAGAAPESVYRASAPRTMLRPLPQKCRTRQQDHPASPVRPGCRPSVVRRAADAYGAGTSRSERRFKMIAASTTTNVTPASQSPATFAGSSDGL